MSQIKPDIGQGGSHLNTDLKQHLVDITDSLNSLKVQVDDLQTKFNAHTHTENAAAAYAQNAATSAPDVAQQSTQSSQVTISK